jgi:murein DD-endopeptidase MepM/ murein hydrolase activator NlpD
MQKSPPIVHYNYRPIKQLKAPSINASRRKIKTQLLGNTWSSITPMRFAVSSLVVLGIASISVFEDRNVYATVQDFWSFDKQLPRHNITETILPNPLNIPSQQVQISLQQTTLHEEAYEETYSEQQTTLHEEAYSDVVDETNEEDLPDPFKISASKLKSHWLTLTIRSGDNLSQLFDRNKLNREDLHEMLDLKDAKKPLQRLQPGQEVRILTTKTGHILALQLTLDAPKELHIVRNQLENGAWQEADFLVSIGDGVPLEARQSLAVGKISQNLAKDSVAAGLPKNLLKQMKTLFQHQVDTSKLKKGDDFHILYNAYYRGTEQVKPGQILAAAIKHKGKLHQSVRYTDAEGYTAYYNPEGNSLQRSFLRHPVKEISISSRFKHRRWHPILKRNRPHRGVDYRGSRGTEILATSDGVVSYKGWKGGYGRTVMLKHGARYETLYAHMTKYGKKLKVGDKIKQGQVIGYMGSTGLASSTHLHYEFHLDDVAKNPLKIDFPKTNQIAKSEKALFLKRTQVLLSSLNTGEGQVAQR